MDPVYDVVLISIEIRMKDQLFRALSIRISNLRRLWILCDDSVMDTWGRCTRSWIWSFCCALATGSFLGRNNQNRSLFVLYLDVNSIINAKFGNDRGKSNILHFSESDLHLVREVRREPNLLRLLVHSLCPTIFGHEIVKGTLQARARGLLPKFLYVVCWKISSTRHAFT